MRRPTLVLLLSALITVSMAVAVPVETQASPSATAPTLTSETLAGPPPSVTLTCRFGVLDFSMTYSASGTAVGAYPGTFTEEGSYSRTLAGAESFEATFRIVSGGTLIIGRKFGGGAAGSVCSESTTVPNCCAGFYIPNARYEAEIQTPGRTFKDRGATAVLAQSGLNFNETFVSDLVTAEPPCDKFKVHKHDPDKSKCKDKDKD